MQWSAVDERFFPMAFLSRCIQTGEPVVVIHVFDPADDEWHWISLDQWREVLAQLHATFH